ncbi:hypothetical protein TGME49_253690 [Toxoplasma gondii ME49]|uniref:Transmembrane protein n=8 Tax=Toxoplasma gondii TaxID=5811 RepID=S7ULT0_TOXGG|nr:hypothetical protein TGME49_253690 [Toxoplasma gondii ME49]EPR59006.1 hypothetical protein TGGT1_253690 [Toxoplasma gondii GT1]KFG47037.1 putative transmembrane protein [Toxoplasma gondii p89]KFG52917.1 putative transmembrane protein [Toxoplasma gondii FOU]KFG60094.1 putative transmembrane protein [Toxoplasma gondii RUB]KFH06532.1 putative transmembrane protein [Toxoplasma gondii VAND]KYF41871.1 hypothetical protein TGARI_253690 [Toxoplasma gondii ARI]PIL97962.1 putative transmembrane pro|eukprot:XP_002369425.1 hypothetical protein TGME49_253690 [Toxoplasma gondii ME49]
MCDADNCCCGVPPPRNSHDSVMLLAGGIINLVFPLGIGTLIAGCGMNSGHLLWTGVFQLICSLLIFGTIWSFIYGILMVVVSTQAPKEATSQQVAAVEVSAPISAAHAVHPPPAPPLAP